MTKQQITQIEKTQKSLQFLIDQYNLNPDNLPNLTNNPEKAELNELAKEIIPQALNNLKNKSEGLKQIASKLKGNLDKFEKQMENLYQQFTNEQLNLAMEKSTKTTNITQETLNQLNNLEQKILQNSNLQKENSQLVA